MKAHVDTYVTYEAPAGTYYIGDLCYHLTGEGEWDEVCSLTIKGHESIDGVFTMADGRSFAMFGTKWGDGTYKDQFGNSYFVDSGTIGCIAVPEGTESVEGGHIITFDKPFAMSNDDGLIKFGFIAIETSSDDEYYYDDEEEED